MESKTKIAFVVLHYLATEDTIECVNSILNNISSRNYSIDIIIVDNGSENQSYNILNEKYKNFSNIKILKSEVNLGFAKGNNLGFQYAKKILKSDFIILVNNDTVIYQSDFADILVKKYIEKGYGVLGPDIISADGYHQNPGNKQSWGLLELYIDRMKKRTRIFLSYFHVDDILSNLIKKTKEIYKAETVSGDVENTILHGACLIFSPVYIDRFDGLYDKTFLYMEEDILKLCADYYGFLMMYTSEIKIFHKEDAATNMIPLKSDEKVRMKYRRVIQSSKEYSKLKWKMTMKKSLNM